MHARLVAIYSNMTRFHRHIDEVFVRTNGDIGDIKSTGA